MEVIKKNNQRTRTVGAGIEWTVNVVAGGFYPSHHHGAVKVVWVRPEGATKTS